MKSSALEDNLTLVIQRRDTVIPPHSIRQLRYLNGDLIGVIEIWIFLSKLLALLY